MRWPARPGLWICPTAAATAVIDTDPTPAAIDRALTAVAAEARRSGRAMAVAQPLPASFERLTAWLASLPEQGFELVPPSRFLQVGAIAGVGAAIAVELPRNPRPEARLPAMRGPVSARDAGGRVLVGQRLDAEGEAWQLPQGGIDPPETPEAAARREMLEEIGTDRADLLRESASGGPTICRRRSRGGDGAAAMPARPRNGWPSASPVRTPTSGSTPQHPEFSDWRWVAPGDARRPDRAVQARRLCQRRRRVPSPMGLTMMVDGIGRGARRSSAGGSAYLERQAAPRAGARAVAHDRRGGGSGSGAAAVGRGAEGRPVATRRRLGGRSAGAGVASSAHGLGGVAGSVSAALSTAPRQRARGRRRRPAPRQHRRQAHHELDVGTARPGRAARRGS